MATKAMRKANGRDDVIGAGHYLGRAGGAGSDRDGHPPKQDAEGAVMAGSKIDLAVLRANLISRAAEVATALLGKPNGGLSSRRETAVREQGLAHDRHGRRKDRLLV